MSRKPRWPPVVLPAAGRVHRRLFRAGGTTASRTEVVAEAVVPVGQRKRVSALLEAALADVGERPELSWS